MKEKIELPVELLQHNPWEEKGDSIWPATSFILRRNFIHSCFPMKQTKEQALRLLQMLRNALGKILQPKDYYFFLMEDLSAADQEFLSEHFLCSQNFQSQGTGQGIFVDPKGHFLAICNVEDHLCLRWINSQHVWEKTWGALARIEKMLSSELTYAFSPRFGYLTAVPAECGTALDVSAYLHLPALIHGANLSEYLRTMEEVTPLSIGGKKEEFLADFVVIKNTHTLGVSEEGILRAVHLAATKLTGLERAARNRIVQEGDAHAKDLISRAFGLLIHSYQLDMKEALSGLSMIKWGIDLGWIEGITDQEINALFFTCQRAHLAHLTKEGNSSEDTHRRRASFLHERLKAAKLQNSLT